MVTYRKATPDDIRPALDLALKVFLEFEAPEYGPEAVIVFKADSIDNKDYSKAIVEGRKLMFIAFDDERIIGMIGQGSDGNQHNGYISMLYVNGAYHRQGIATALLSNMICELKLRGFDRITLNSSPYGIPFYLHYGFMPTDSEQKRYAFIFTPMEYEPKEIWDVLDEHGNKTGRYAERGRKMATGDYHLVVHVWKHNKNGEWLIDKRTNRGTSMDGKWETTGGAALAGDDSLTAALRETKEELGIELDPQKGTLIHKITRHGNDGHTWFQEAWVFEWDGSIENVRFQESETCDAMWATADKIHEMMDSGEFLSKWFYPYFDDMVEKWRGVE